MYRLNGVIKFMLYDIAINYAMKIKCIQDPKL